jgi:hypothetical protein
MKRAILKWRISRAIDRPQDVSVWLRSQIERDHALKRFEQAARRLERDLRKDSPAWIGHEGSWTDAKATTCAREKVLRKRWTTSPGFSLSLTAALAACLIGTVLIWNARVDQSSSTPGEMALADSSVRRTSPVDAKAIAEVIDAGHALIQPLARITASRQRLPNMDVVRSGIRASYDRMVDVDEADQVWEDVKSMMHKERRHLTTDLRSAYLFFSHRLPRSTARLMGLVGSNGP